MLCSSTNVSLILICFRKFYDGPGNEKKLCFISEIFFHTPNIDGITQEIFIHYVFTFNFNKSLSLSANLVLIFSFSSRNVANSKAISP